MAVRRGSFDVIGVLLLSPGLATFLFAVSSIPRCGTMAIAAGQLLA
jgi:hypothetical protein